jgi:hypothetical protein
VSKRTVAARILAAYHGACDDMVRLAREVTGEWDYKEYCAYVAGRTLVRLRGDPKALYVAVTAGVDGQCPRATAAAIASFRGRAV